MKSNGNRIFSFLVSNANFKKIAKNFISLGIIQATGFLVPIILLPYLVRTLGIATYGLMIFAQTIVGYFESVMQYSFSLTAVHEVSQHVNDPHQLRAIVNRVLGAKLILAVLVALILFVISFVVPSFSEIRILLLLSIIYCFGYILNFDWFFQGIQEMKHITYLTLIARVFSIIWVFVFVHSKQDVAKAFLTVPLSYLLSGLCGALLLIFKYKVQFQLCRMQSAIQEIRKGFYIFTSQILVRFYSADINITLLGFWAGSTAVGVYAVAYRIFSLFMVLSNLITLSVFPYLAAMFKTNHQAYLQRTTQVYLFAFVTFSLLSIGVFVFADSLIYLASGAYNITAASCLRILAFALVLSPFPPLNNQVFVINFQAKWLPKIAILAVIINLIVFYPAFRLYNLQGLAIANVIVYLSLTISGILVLRYKQLLFTRKIALVL